MKTSLKNWQAEVICNEIYFDEYAPPQALQDDRLCSESVKSEIGERKRLWMRVLR